MAEYQALLLRAPGRKSVPFGSQCNNDVPLILENLVGASRADGGSVALCVDCRFTMWCFFDGR